MTSPVLQFKRGLFVNLPGLRAGEPGFTTDTYDLYVGLTSETSTNKFFGSHRYWGREDGTNSLRLKLVDKNGSNYVAIKSPDTLAGIVTYTLPGVQGANSTVLTNDGSGNLTWASGSANPVFTGIATFTDTTDNTLGDVNTGAVQIDGGVGIAKNVTIGAGLSVAGQSYFIGTATFYGGQINLGDSDGDNISVAGEFVSNLVPNATNTYDLGLTGKRWRNGFYSGSVEITGNLSVDGNVTIGGTSVTLLGQDVYIQNKDIILGYTTSITNADISTDDSANHGGVAIASTVGSPLTSFAASGINTLPDTYKQLMWFKQGTLGFGTDAFAFNYGLAIGTTTMANGVRLAVGSGITMSDNSISATTFYGTLTGSITGNAASADQVKTVTASDAGSTHYLTFVNSHNGSATNETVYTDDGIYYNPGTNTFTTQYGYFTANVTVDGTITGTATTATRAQSVDVVGVATNQNYYITLVDSSGNAKSVGVDSELLYNPNTNTLTVGTGVGITQFSGSVSTGNSTSSVPTSSAIIEYVRNADFGIVGDTGSGSVNMDHTFTISGTASEVETSVSGQTVTIGLPDAVVVGTSLSAPTLRTGTIQSSNTGATAITIAANDVTIVDDLTVGGNLYVNGNTTQVNTSAITVEDRTIELGVVDGSAPSSSTTWDLGVLFNYYDGSAKKSAVVWEQGDQRFKLASVLGADSNGTNNSTPQLTVTTFAPIEVAELWVNNSCTGGAQQVIGCSGGELKLQNIIVDAGTF
jgi:hypothetical protein